MSTAGWFEAAARKKGKIPEEMLADGWRVVTPGKEDSDVKLSFISPDETTSTHVIVTQKEHDIEVAFYEAETGKCHVCMGLTQEVCGWDNKTGKLTRPCKRCAATGNAPVKP